MAYFKLSLLFLGDNQYVNNAIEYLPSVISEFYSQTEERESALANNWDQPQKNTFCFTYNEQFGIHSNSQKELSFSMDRMVLMDNEWVENPYAQHMQIGTQLLLEDKYNNQYLFTVSKIAYTFKLNNITYNITCQDTFNYQLTRQNDGYEISNNADETDFIGAKDVDWWTNKIAKECHIAYQYIPLEQSLYQNTNHLFLLTTGQQYGNQLQKLIKQSFSRQNADDLPLFEKIPFSGSGNAASILINLGEQLGLVLKTFEHFQYSESGTETNILIRYFWFEPAKNNIVSGLKYSPFDSIQQFSLTHTGTALTTVLNVSGPTYEDELITLLPDISPFFLQLFQSEQWTNSQYYPNMYSDLMNATTYHYNQLTGGDFEIANVSDKYLDDTLELIDGSASDIAHIPCFICDTGSGSHAIIQQVFLPIHDLKKETFYIPNIYDKVSFSTNQSNSRIQLELNQAEEGINHFTLFSGDTQWGLYQFDHSNGSWEAQEIATKKYGQNLEKVFLGINVANKNLWVLRSSETARYSDVDIYLQFSRIPTVDDETFASIADQIPWLENKLIDFSYFTNHNLLNKYQFSLLSKKINDDLRIVNGQLIWYTKEYYQALHKKTETLANIQNMIDALGATFNYEIVDTYRTTGRIDNLENFQHMYNTMLSAWHPAQKEPILDYDETISSYLTKYFNAQQRFYKNIKNFRDYFEAPVSFLQGDSQLTQDIITLYNNHEDVTWGENELQKTVIYSTFNFENGNDTVLLNNTFTDYDPETYTPNVNIYDYHTLSNIDVVTGTNYKNSNYNYAVKVGGKDFYYQDGSKPFDLKQKYYLPMVSVEVQTTTDLSDTPVGLTIELVGGVTAVLKLHQTNLISKISQNNSSYIYTYRLLYWASHNALNNWYAQQLANVDKNAWYNYITNVTLSGNAQLLSSYQIVWIQATTNLMLQNYLGFSTHTFETLYTRNYDTYRQWLTTFFFFFTSYIIISTSKVPLYTTYPWHDQYTISNQWGENNSLDLFKQKYYQFLPITELYWKGKNYKYSTQWDIYNKNGQNLYAYLKAKTIQGDDTKIINPFNETTEDETTDNTQYIPIPIANQENYTSYYHYVNHFEVSTGVAIGLGGAAVINWWNPVGWCLAIGAGIAATCAISQALPNTAVLAQTGVGMYALEPMFGTDNTIRPGMGSWTSDLVTIGTDCNCTPGFVYATTNNAIDQCKKYRAIWEKNWDTLTFEWKNTSIQPTATLNQTIITPAMFDSITQINDPDHQNYNLTFTYQDKITYWKLDHSTVKPTDISSSTKWNKNYWNVWNYWNYFVPTISFLNEVGNMDWDSTEYVKPYMYNLGMLLSLYIKEKYYRIILPNETFDKNNNYYVIPLIRAYTNDSGQWESKDFMVKHNNELPYCLLTELATNLQAWINDSYNNKSIYTLLNTSIKCSGLSDERLINRDVHYPLVQNAIKFDLTADPTWKPHTTTWKDIITSTPSDDNQIEWHEDFFVIKTATGVFQSLCIVVQAQDYKLDSINTSSRNYDSFHKYYTSQDLEFDWTVQQQYTEGLYTPVIYDDIRSTNDQTSFDPYGHYYNVNGQRVYTLTQLINGQSVADGIVPCLLNTTRYEEVNLNRAKTEFVLPVIQTIHTNTYERRLTEITSDTAKYSIGDKYQDSNITGIVRSITVSTEGDDILYHYTISADTANDHYAPELVSSSLNKKSYVLTFEDTQKTNIELENKEIDNEIVYFSIQSQALEDLHAVNNGTFWYYYHENPKYPILFELAAAIETQLQVYWSQAYNASLYCDYFLPQYWQSRVDNTYNFFSAKIFTLDTNKNVQLNNEFIPNIEQLLTPTNAVKMPRYQFKYISTINMSDFDENNYISIDQLPEINLQECFTRHNLSTNNWYAEKIGTTNYYRILSGGTTWSELLNKNLKVKTTPLTEYTGIYPLLLKYFVNAYIERSIFNYQYLKNKHDSLWKQLYTQYPSVVLEGNYHNDDATTSQDLLILAQNEFKDKSYPERGYTITVIDNLSLLHGYEGQELKIGDSIALRANEFYDGFDDIKNSLSQYLFITDIKYTLRKDTDVSLTVNSIKYQDKMLQRLVKLIK